MLILRCGKTILRHTEDFKESVEKFIMDKKKDVATEVIQDMFTLYLCFQTQSKVKNIFIQELYGSVFLFCIFT